jgi:predicted peroxiredoxin
VDREKLVVFMLTGPENPRRCVTPFLVAMAALASDWDVSMYFACDGVLLLKRGLAATLYVMEGGRPLSEFMRQAMDLGAKLYGCSPAPSFTTAPPTSSRASNVTFASRRPGTRRS